MSNVKEGKSGPRQHLLEVAGELFYREGIHAVGIDRILHEAGTTRSTMYRHFNGKEGLVVAYLKREDEMLRQILADAEDYAASPDHLLQLTIDGIVEDATRHHTRGCPFINATAEYPDEDSPVRRLVTDHRDWFHDTLRRYLADAKRPEPFERAATLGMLRDAVLVGSYIDDAGSTQRSFVRAARAVAMLD
jgi:AcrR family transcriptional regulator